MKTLAETVVTSTLGILLAGSLVQFNVATLWSADRTLCADSLTRAGRAGLDEILYQTRNAGAIVPTLTLDNETLASDQRTLVLAAPSFDTSRSDFRIAGQTDTIVIAYDPAAGTLSETIVRGLGTARPSRSNFVIARNVAAFTIRYTVRDTFTAPDSGPTNAYTLTQPPAAGVTPTVLVDGVPVAASVSGDTLTITSTTPAAGAIVQTYYEVAPHGSVSSAIGVTVTMDLRASGRRRTTQTYSVDGSARLRNQRR